MALSSSRLLQRIAAWRSGHATGHCGMASVASEMISFARTNTLAGQTQSVDVLTSGLANVQSPLEQSRLHLALSDLHADSGAWARSNDHAQQALQLTAKAGDREGADRLAHEGLRLATNACSAAEDLPWPVWDLWQEHAIADHKIANLLHVCQQQQRLAQGQRLDADECEALTKLHLTAAGSPDLQYRTGILCMALGKSELAHDAFQRAAETAQSDLGTDVARSYIPPRAAQELQAAGQLGQAQTMFILQAKHDQRQLAEDLLSEAVSAAEQVSGVKHPRVALVLTTLADLYARTQRITMAEGLFRTATTVLGLNPSAEGSSGLGLAHTGRVHSSAAALVAWRYAQLLQALPKRGTEVQAWSKLASRLCQGGRQPHELYGSLSAHAESSSRGEGLALDLVSLRAFKAPA